MARNNRKQPTSTRRSTLLAAALVIYCALSLAFIATTAAAKREHSKSTPDQPAPAEASTPAAGGQAGAAPASTTETAETGAAGASGKAGSGHSSGGQAGGGQAGGGQAGGGQAGGGQAHGQTNAPSGPVSPHHDHHGGSTSNHGSSNRSSSSTSGTSSGAAVQPASAGQQPADSSAGASTEATAEAQAKHKKETKPKHPKEPGKKGKGKGKGSKGSGSGEGENETGSGAGTGSGSGTEESTGTSKPDLPVLTTPTLTATPPAVAAEPTVAAAATIATLAPAATTSITNAGAGSRSARASHHAKASRRHSAAALRASVDALAAAGAAPLSAPAAVAREAVARHTHKGAGPSAKAAKRRSRPSPLVNTITKIVGVVPVAVRMLIAALLGLALLLAVRSRVAALRARRLERQRVQLLEDVGLLQAALLPVAPERLGPVGTSAAYQPAAGPGAGGDFYDVFALADGQLAVIVGDVSGHGREALPHTALVRFTLRAYLEAGLSPRDALQTAGAVLERQLGNVFATVVVATYQPRERMLVYACAGHPPPVVLGWGAGSRSGVAPAGSFSAHAIAPVTVSASPPIGVGMRTGTRQTVVAVPGHSQICFYTDGLTEARVGSELFGSERLIATLTELGPGASASAVLERVADLADARPDDMAACLLNVEGYERAPAVLVDELEVDRDEALSARTERFLLACGVERQELAETMRAASVAAEQRGTVVLEARHSDGPPEVTLQREQIAYLHARRANMEVAL